jgi:hypothetical protein
MKREEVFEDKGGATGWVRTRSDISERLRSSMIQFEDLRRTSKSFVGFVGGS